MYYLINKNPDIKGINNGSKEFGFTQFPDDTTLILDSSQSSLQAALHTIEEFKLLGRWFSVDLMKIPSINYSLTLDDAKKLISNWKKRNLTQS